MIRRLWPLALKTPHLPIGLPVSDALSILSETGASVVADIDGDEELFRVALPQFEMAFYQ